MESAGEAKNAAGSQSSVADIVEKGQVSVDVASLPLPSAGPKNLNGADKERLIDSSGSKAASKWSRRAIAIAALSALGIVALALGMGLGLSSRKTDAPDTLAVDVAMATSHYERLGNITTVATSGPNKDEPQADITCNFMHLSSQQCTLFKLSLGSEGMLVTSLAKTTLGPTLIVTGETVLLGGTKFELQLNITYAKESYCRCGAFPCQSS